jgi:hypothetical protein
MIYWRSVDTVVENGRVHVLQQRIESLHKGGTAPTYGNEHRLVALSELEGVRPNDADVGGVDRIG